MGMTNGDSVILRKLAVLYQQHEKTAPLVLNGICYTCRADVSLQIHKTTAGYGINGGTVFVACNGDLMIKCMCCSPLVQK